MDRHLVLKLRPGSLPDAGAWYHQVHDKAGVAPSLTPAIDGVLRAHGTAVWITREYAPAASDGRWNADEIAAGVNRVYRLVLRDETAVPPELIHQISLLPEVEFVRVGQIGATPLPEARAQSTTTDDWSRQVIGVPEAHRWGEGEPEVLIAVLDTGVDVQHVELAPVMAPGFDFVNIIDGADRFIGDYLDADDDPADPVGHGTHVSGIIAGQGVGMPRGVVPRCRVLPVRVLGAMRRAGRPIGAGLVDNINAGLKWAIDQGADVVNMSFGLPSRSGGIPHREVVEYGLRRGVVMVAAAGNDGSDRELYYPGALPGVFAIGATDPTDEVAAFSTYGPQVLLTAPGTEVFSSFPGDGYAFASGTSQAAPFVAGAAALLQSLAVAISGERLRPDAIRRLLVQTADRPDARYRTPRGGYGRLNVADAVRLLDRTGPPGSSLTTDSPRWRIPAHQGHPQPSQPGRTGR